MLPYIRINFISTRVIMESLHYFPRCTMVNLISYINPMVFTGGIVIMAATVTVWKHFPRTLCQASNPAADRCNSQSIDNLQIQSIGAYPELPKLNWFKVGQIEKLFMYPLNSGVGNSCRTARFTQLGMNTKKKGMTFWDGMFLVYNDNTKKFQGFWEYGALITVAVTEINESKVQLTALGMPNLIIDMDEDFNKSNATYYSESWHEPNIKIKYIDCGTTAAEWLNMYLRTTNLRLVQRDCTTEQTNVKEDWSHYLQAYGIAREENLARLHPDLPRYVMMTTKTLTNLHKTSETFYETLRFRPSIVVSDLSSLPFIEKDWEWIKMGNVIMRKIKTVPRYFVDLDFAPSLRKMCDDASHLGIYCKLYISGDVSVGDDVFVHILPKDSENGVH